MWVSLVSVVGTFIHGVVVIDHVRSNPVHEGNEHKRPEVAESSSPLVVQGMHLLHTEAIKCVNCSKESVIQ